MAEAKLTPPSDARPIPRAPEYLIVDGGVVWSDRAPGRNRYYVGPRVWHIMKPIALKRSGHLRVGLTINGKQRWFLVHRLVLEAFVGPCPPGMECCHEDDNPLNNFVSNLRWDTPAGNMADRVKHGLARAPIGEAQSKAKLRDADIPEIVRLWASGIGYTRISRMYGVNRSIVYGIIKGKLWKHITKDLLPIAVRRLPMFQGVASSGRE